MTMNAVIKLTATQFNAGIKQVQRSLNSLVSTVKQTAGVLAGGIGFGYILREIKETATKFSIAKATLENVAEDATKYGKNVGNGVKSLGRANAEYQKNMEFLKRISNEYGQSLLGITQAFAKFRAAAGYAGVSLDEIKKIYEALTKAAGAFHLSQENTQNAMIAVEQMFSKGKVTSEELRRQLGNALPGAFGLMAKAAYNAGLITENTTGAFEAAMKKGEILAKDVLPKFAEELNKITEGANFDSLQSSINRLSNAWVEFVEKTNFEGGFKKLIDTGAKALNFLSNNFNQVSQTIISLLAGIGGGRAFSKLEKIGTKAAKGIQEEYGKLERNNIQLTNHVGKLAKSYTEAGNAAASIPDARIDVQGLTAAEAKAAGLNQGLVNIIANNEKMGKVVTQYSLKAADAQKVYAKRVNDTQVAIKGNEEAMKKLARTSQLAGTAGGRALIGLKNAAVAAGAAIKTALASIGIGILISVLTQVIAKLADILSFSNKLKKQAEEINKEVHTTNSEVNTQIAEAKSLEKIVNDTSLEEEKRKNALKRLNELLGLSDKKALTFKSTAGEINKAIAKWSDNITKAAQRMAMLNKIGELTTRNLEINQEITSAKSDKKWYNSVFVNGKIKRLEKEKQQNTELIKKLQDEADALTAELAANALDDGGGGGGGGGGNNGKLADLKKVIDKYKEKLKELENQRENGAISAEELYDSKGKLNESTWKEIAAFDNLEGKLKSLGEGYVDLAHTIQMSSIDYQITKGIEKDIEDANKAIEKEIEDMISKMEAVQKKFYDIVNDPMPKLEQRDTFHDYKKDDYEIFDEEADNAEDYAKELGKIIEKLQELRRDSGQYWGSEMQSYLDTLIKKFNEAADSAADIRKKAKIAELSKDIKDLKKELEGTRFDAVSDFAGAFHSLGESVINCAKAFEELEDREGEIINEESLKKYKAFMSLLDEITQMINTVNTLVKSVTEVNEKKAELDKAIAAQEQLTTAQNIANKQQETATAVENAAVITGAEKAKQVAIQTTSSVEQQSASQTVAAEAQKKAAVISTTGEEASGAIVGGMKSVASVPYVGPILAAAAAATITALVMSALNKFANGGIVGGSSTSGDKNVIRANSSEMLLNRQQQANLFAMINRGGSGGGQVEFILRGDRLQGVLNNYNSKRRG